MSKIKLILDQITEELIKVISEWLIIVLLPPSLKFFGIANPEIAVGQKTKNQTYRDFFIYSSDEWWTIQISKSERKPEGSNVKAR